MKLRLTLGGFDPPLGLQVIPEEAQVVLGDNQTLLGCVENPNTYIGRISHTADLVLSELHRLDEFVDSVALSKLLHQLLLPCKPLHMSPVRTVTPPVRATSSPLCPPF
jgi:hypothetical protein